MVTATIEPERSNVTAEQLVRHELEQRGVAFEQAGITGRVIVAFAPIAQAMLHCRMRRERHPYLGSIGRLEGAWVVTGRVGSPCAAIQVEKLAVLGAKEVLYLGIAGALPLEGADPFGPGDLVVSTGALNETGTGVCYGYAWKGVVPGAIELTARLSRWLSARGTLRYQGLHWCTDAPFCETPTKARELARLGASFVEMEAAGLFAACERRNVPAAAAFVISDQLGDDGWTPGWHTSAFRSGLKTFAKQLVEEAGQI